MLTSMSPSKSAAAQESNAEKDLAVSMYPVINISQQCFGGEERKKKKRETNTKESREMSTVSDTHEAIISISSAQHSDVLQQPVWHFKEVPNRKVPEQDDKQDLRAENSKAKGLFGFAGRKARQEGWQPFSNTK